MPGSSNCGKKAMQIDPFRDRREIFSLCRWLYDECEERCIRQYRRVPGMRNLELAMRCRNLLSSPKDLRPTADWRPRPGSEWPSGPQVMEPAVPYPQHRVPHQQTNRCWRAGHASGGRSARHASMALPPWINIPAIVGWRLYEEGIRRGGDLAHSCLVNMMSRVNWSRRRWNWYGWLFPEGVYPKPYRLCGRSDH